MDETTRIPTHQCDQCWPPGQVPEAGFTVEELKAERRAEMENSAGFAAFSERVERKRAERAGRT
jgi:hypothetical protein